MSTAQAQFLRRAGLPPAVAGALWLGPMPGRQRPLREDLEALAEAKVSRIICLAPPEEVARKSPDYAALQPGVAIAVTGFPISDFGIPEDEEGLRSLVDRAARDLLQGQSLFLHCAAGIGRTGMVGICILVALGLGLEEAKAAIAAAGSGPETEIQRELVCRLAAGMRRPALSGIDRTGRP